MILILTSAMMRSTGIATTNAPAAATSRTRQSRARERAADGVAVCSRSADLYCSLAAFHWARGETTRSSRRRWRLPSRHVSSCLACVSRQSNRAPAPFRSPCRARRLPSRPRISMPARQAISTSATSTSAIASRQEICSPGSPCRSSMTRFHRTRRRSISSSRRGIRWRPVESWQNRPGAATNRW